MCRHLAYLGPARSPAELLFDAPHSLSAQACAPREMRGGGTVNVDGFGLAWYTTGNETRRYGRSGPIWADEYLASLASDVHSTAYVAAVRAATPGMPVSDAACAPFAEDGWVFSHNGVVQGWPDSMSELAATLPVPELLRMAAPTDSVLVWSLLRARLRDGQKPEEAVTGLVADVERAASGSRLNLLLTDGDIVVATAWRHALAVRVSDNAVLVASEPCDDGADWRPVPDGHAVLARPGSKELIPIPTKD